MQLQLLVRSFSVACSLVLVFFSVQWTEPANTNRECQQPLLFHSSSHCWPYKMPPKTSSMLTHLILYWNPLHLCIRNPSRAKHPAEDLNNCSTVMMRCCADPALWTVTSWMLAYILCEYTGQLNQYWSAHSTNLHHEGCLHWSWQLVFESKS